VDRVFNTSPFNEEENENGEKDRPGSVNKFTKGRGTACHRLHTPMTLEEMEMRILGMFAFAAVVAAAWITPDHTALAQTGAQAPVPCGVSTYSVAEQRNVVMPCTQSSTTTAGKDSGQPGCGVSTYSVADQRNVVVPCASTATTNSKDSAGTACGMEVWSTAEQRNITTPCQ
jgi:hypothetical protein